MLFSSSLKLHYRWIYSSTSPKLWHNCTLNQLVMRVCVQTKQKGEWRAVTWDVNIWMMRSSRVRSDSSSSSSFSDQRLREPTEQDRYHKGNKSTDELIKNSWFLIIISPYIEIRKHITYIQLTTWCIFFLKSPPALSLSRHLIYASTFREAARRHHPHHKSLFLPKQLIQQSDTKCRVTCPVWLTGKKVSSISNTHLTVCYTHIHTQHTNRTRQIRCEFREEEEVLYVQIHTHRHTHGSAPFRPGCRFPEPLSFISLQKLCEADMRSLRRFEDRNTQTVY